MQQQQQQQHQITKQGFTRAADPSTLPDVISVLDDLQAAGITVIRTWAFADGPQWSALQPSPGVFDENIFCGLDRVIAEAGLRGIRILFNLINFWSDYGGMPQYVAWSRQARGLPPPLSKKEHQQQNEAGASAAAIASEFYQDPWCQATFLNFVKTLILRTNTITGVKYRDDPIILGFAPANEPQCLCDPGCHGSTLATWAHCTAAEIKKIDPNHLVFMDCEGFWGPAYQPESKINEQVSLILNRHTNQYHCTSIEGRGGGGNPYDCSYNGCDFISDCGSSYIDVACCHMYPDLWLPDASEETKLNFAVAWVDAHVEACAQVLKKPLILSEFGKKRAENTSTVPNSTREVYFEAILTRCIDHMKTGHPLAGSIFWTAAAESYPDYDGFTVYLPQKKRGSRVGEEDKVAELIKEHAGAVNQLNERRGQVFDGGSGGVGDRREEGEESSTASQLFSKTKGILESKLGKLRTKFPIH